MPTRRRSSSPTPRRTPSISSARPEGELALAQATLYLATAPKSNAVYTAFKAATRAAKEHGSLMPPKTILNAPTKLMKKIGYGEGYRYDHDEPDAFSGQDYWPDRLGRQAFYEPADRGFEREMRKRLDWWAKLRRERAAASRMTAYLLVFLGAGIGGALRHAVNVACARGLRDRLSRGARSPSTSSARSLMGVLAGWLAFRAGEAWAHPARLFLATGLLGGFTTFSAFSLDAVAPVGARRSGAGLRLCRGLGRPLDRGARRRACGWCGALA